MREGYTRGRFSHRHKKEIEEIVRTVTRINVVFPAFVFPFSLLLYGPVRLRVVAGPYIPYGLVRPRVAAGLCGKTVV